MIMNSQYYLQPNNFQDKIKTIWQKLQFDNDFYDMTLACAGKQIHVHKCVVSSISPLLKSILKQTSIKNPVIYMASLKFKHLEYLVSFVYKGEVTIDEEDMEHFLDLANELEIRGLTEAIVNTEINLTKINSENTSTSRKENNEEQFVKIKANENEEKNDVQHDANEAHLSFKNLSPKTTVKPSKLENKDSRQNTKEDKRNDNIEKEDMFETKNTENGLQRDNVLEKVRKEKNECNRQRNGEYKCGHCDYQTNTISQHKRHVTSIHNQSSLYQCNECDYKKSSVHHLRRHYEAVHEGIRFPCKLCKYKASERGNLKRHMDAKHLGHHHQCDKCDFKTTEKINLKIHAESIHIGIWYPCDYCDHKAKSPNRLKRHVEKIHNLSFECNYCDHKTSTKFKLKMHNKKSHKNYP